MKTSRCVSIQIFPFQLPLFWWAYCSLFPWHPAALLQLLIFTSTKENLAAQASTEAKRNSRYRRSDQDQPLGSANGRPRDYSLDSKTRTREALSASCVIPAFSRGLKTKTSAAAQRCPADWSEVMVMPNTIRKSNWHLWHIVYVG